MRLFIILSVVFIVCVLATLNKKIDVLQQQFYSLQQQFCNGVLSND